MSKIKCDKCGSEIDEKSKFCPNCGAKIEFSKKAEKVEVVEAVVKDSDNTTNNTEKGYNVLSIIGFILAFIPKLWIVSFIISIIALVQISKTKEKGKELAIAGISISSFLIAIGLIALIVGSISGMLYWLFRI